MKENYLEKLCGSWNSYPNAFYEGELPGEALRELKILVHFMTENNYLAKRWGSWNPHPNTFYEGELPGEALRELESLS